MLLVSCGLWRGGASGCPTSLGLIMWMPFAVSTHHVLSCCVDVVHAIWVLLAARPTSMLVGNVTAVCPAVVVVV